MNETSNEQAPEESKTPIIDNENPIYTDEQGDRWATVRDIIQMFSGLTEQRILDHTRLSRKTWKLGYDTEGNYLRLYLISPDWQK